MTILLVEPQITEIRQIRLKALCRNEYFLSQAINRLLPQANGARITYYTR